jgi:hypothetical protein
MQMPLHIRQRMLMQNGDHLAVDAINELFHPLRRLFAICDNGCPHCSSLLSNRPVERRRPIFAGGDGDA